MAGNFDDIMPNDVAVMVDEIGETVTWKFADGVTADRSFKAIVLRPAPQVSTEFDRGRSFAITAWVRNDDTDGVQSVQVNADKISVKGRMGEAAADLVVAQVEFSNAAVWRLRLR